MNRRKFLQNSSLLAMGSTIASSSALATEPQINSKKGALVVAFLSDIHVKPNEAAEIGMRKAFRHVNTLKQKPNFIINGGDAIMDAMAADRQKTQEQWDVWNRILNAENHLPIYHVIGNHDAWGWQVKDASIKTDPLYNKGWAVKQHGMPNRYYAFDQKGWKFIVLDSAHENNGGYISKIDEEQFAWLEKELRNTPDDQHVCLASHIPIVSFCAAMFFDDPLPNGDWKLSRALLHTDARKLTQLFAQYKNIRCCLSGHIHLQDVVEYKGIQYFCNGAVSGNWWKGAFKGFDPAYAIFKFYQDGRVEREMVQYG